MFLFSVKRVPVFAESWMFERVLQVLWKENFTDVIIGPRFIRAKSFNRLVKHSNPKFSSDQAD